VAVSDFVAEKKGSPNLLSEIIPWKNYLGNMRAV